MKLTTWLHRRDALSKAYGLLLSEAATLMFLHNRGTVGALRLVQHSRKLDAAYLAICAIDREGIGK